MAIDNDDSLRLKSQELNDSMTGASKGAYTLNDAFREAGFGIKTHKQSLQDFVKGVDNVRVELKGAISSLAKDLTGAGNDLKMFNTVIDASANAAGGLVKGIPIIGEALNAAAQAVGAGAKMVLEKLSEVSRTFKEFGAVGALASDGMSGIVRQANASGQSLESYKKVVTANATTMARFKGTVGEGAEEFSKFSGSLASATSEEGLLLRRLGLGADSIAEGAAGFLTQQTRLGLSQGKTVDQMKQGTIDYIKELDLLSKMTGMSAKAAQDQQAAALSGNRFRAVQDEMISQGRVKEAKVLLDLQTSMSSFDAGIAEGIQDLSAGGETTEKARQLQAATGGAALGILERVKKGEISAAEAQKQIIDASRKMQASMVINSKLSAENQKLYGNTAAWSDAQKAAINAEGLAIKTQKQQQEKTDDLTEKTISAEKALERTKRLADQAMYAMLPYAADAAEAFATALQNGAEALEKYFGKKTSEPLGSTTTTSPSGATTTTNVAGTVKGTAGGAATSVIRKGRWASRNEPAAETPGAAPAAAPGAAPGAAAPAAPAAGGGKNAISNSILNLKSSESTAGGDAAPELLSYAQKIQDMYPGAKFTALNDAWHQRNKPGSQHTKGRALDFTLPVAPSPEAGVKIAADLKTMGFSYVQDEYAKPSAGSTGGHFHAQLAKLATGGVVSGPRSGYEATLHGTEAVVPLPDGRSIPVSNPNGSGSIEIQAAQLNALEELVSTMKNQVSISSKILQYAQ